MIIGFLSSIGALIVSAVFYTVFSQKRQAFLALQAAVGHEWAEEDVPGDHHETTVKNKKGDLVVVQVTNQQVAQRQGLITTILGFTTIACGISALIFGLLLP